MPGFTKGTKQHNVSPVKTRHRRDGHLPAAGALQPQRHAQRLAVPHAAARPHPGGCAGDAGGALLVRGGAAAVASLAIAVRAQRRLGRPAPRPFVAAHWRLGQLYKNAEDPALFVPTRDGRRWTLNFGRPVAGALLGLILVAGVLGPTVLIALALR